MSRFPLGINPCSLTTNQIVSKIGAELTIEVSGSSSSIFSTIFEHLDTMKSELGIKSYGVNINSLDDVFLKLVFA